MLKKVCPNCGKPSYSASEFGLWICPKCEANLRYVEPEPAGSDYGDCFWCGDRIVKTSSGKYICLYCGREQKESGVKRDA